MADMSDPSERRGYYEAYRRLFIHDELRPSLRDFAKKHNMQEIDKFYQYAKRQDWEFERDRYQDTLGKKVSERMLELQSFDQMSKLREIQAMKTKAWEAAINLTFKNAKDAVNSYTELEKLERLIQGQSTENLQVADLTTYMQAVAVVLKEELTPLEYETVQMRLRNLTFGNMRDVIAQGRRSDPN